MPGIIPKNRSVVLKRLSKKKKGIMVLILAREVRPPPNTSYKF